MALKPAPFNFPTDSADTGHSAAPALGFAVITSPVLGTPLRVQLGESPPKITAGYATFEEQIRPRRRTGLIYTGMDPLKMDLNILFDGYGSGKSQEARIRKLESLAVSRGGSENEPAIIRVSGPIPHSGESWWIQSIDWGDMVIYGKYARLRQDAVLHLVQAVRINLALDLEARSPAKKGKGYRRVTVKQGQTLKTIAQIMLGDSRKWNQILSVKGQRFRDPNVSAGTPIRVPVG